MGLWAALGGVSRAVATYGKRTTRVMVTASTPEEDDDNASNAASGSADGRAAGSAAGAVDTERARAEAIARVFGGDDDEEDEDRENAAPPSGQAGKMASSAKHQDSADAMETDVVGPRAAEAPATPRGGSRAPVSQVGDVPSPLLESARRKGHLSTRPIRIYTLEELLWKDILGSPPAEATDAASTPARSLDARGTPARSGHALANAGVGEGEDDDDDANVATPTVVLPLPSNALPPRLQPLPPLSPEEVSRQSLAPGAFPRPSLAPRPSAGANPSAAPRESLAPAAFPRPPQPRESLAPSALPPRPTPTTAGQLQPPRESIAPNAFPRPSLAPSAPNAFPRPSLAPSASSNLPRPSLAPGAVPRESLAPGAFKPRESLAAPLPVPARRALQELTVDDMLRACRQDKVQTMEDFIGRRCLNTVTKLGESTFAEVFNGIFNDCRVAMKIVPFGGDIPVNGCPQTSMDDVYQELRITQLLSETAAGSQTDVSKPRTNFIYAHKLGICSGAYPRRLLEEWDRFAATKRSENDRPDMFPPTQLYAVLILTNAGVDLEHCTLQSLVQAKSILFQVCLSLAAIEKKYRFEHRDLHWGNILTVPTTHQTFCYEIDGKVVKAKTMGVCATIIDYTLSRLQLGRELLCVELSDEDYFTGQGDYQFEIYRLMRTETGGQWSGFHPRTNVLWLHYLLDKCLNGIRYMPAAAGEAAPQAGTTGPTTRTSRRRPLGEAIAPNAPLDGPSSATRQRRAAAAAAVVALETSFSSTRTRATAASRENREDRPPQPKKASTAGVGGTAAEKREYRAFAERVLTYRTMTEVVADRFFASLITAE